jgi:hypothetical protein
MDAQPQEDSLDARLRDEASYIDDAGFTAAVVQKLPAQRQVRRSYRAGILLAVTLVAGVIAYLMSGGGSFIGGGRFRRHAARGHVSLRDRGQRLSHGLRRGRGDA